MSLIAIAGRIYAGKDETAKVIQRLTRTKAFMNSDGYGNIPRDKYEIKKYAAKLKQIASILTGIPVEKFEDRDFKASFLSDEWSYLPKVGDPDYGMTDGIGLAYKRMTVREFLQKLGTDCVRFGLHENTWVNALFADYKRDYIPVEFRDPTIDCLPGYPSWIITDCRFPNEYDAVKSRDGIIIRVTRGDDDTIDKTNLHASETSLDGFEFDWMIDNTGDLHHLEQEVTSFLKHFDLLPH